ncbi:MAG: hypothetical protein J6331_09580 [Lentisphaeria bacterium]|nr:hypothetical protein [Lentisphaeria bacterium]
MKNALLKTFELFSCGALFLALFLTTSCIRLEYSGETLKPLDEDARVGVYYNASKLPLPPEKLKKVGTLSASSSTASHTVNDMRQKILECAREHGANVVLFTSVEYTPDGEARPDQIQNISAPGWDRVDNTETNVRQEWSAFLNTGRNETDIPIYKVKMNAVLYLAPAELLRPREVQQTRKPSFPVPQGEKKVKVNVH